MPSLLQFSRRLMDFVPYKVEELPDCNATGLEEYVVCVTSGSGSNLGCKFAATVFVTLPGTQYEYVQSADTASKYLYLVTAVDTMGSESSPTPALTVYTRPPQTISAAVIIFDSVGGVWTEMDSLEAFYERTLSPYQPEILYQKRRRSSALGWPPQYSQIGKYDAIIFDGSDRIDFFRPNATPDSPEFDWLLDYTRSGGTLVYVGNGVNVGFRSSLPQLTPRAFDNDMVASRFFGIDSSLIISEGVHNPSNSDDTLFHYFDPVGAVASSISDFPDLDYHKVDFYRPAVDYFNDGPIALKGILYPQSENTETLYFYRSGKDPVSILDGQVAGFKFTASTHTAYTFLMSPWEWPPEQAEVFFAKILGDFPTDVGDEPHATVLPKTFELGQNYPNPFNPTTTISYSVPKRTLVTLQVFNVLGQRVATLVNEEKDSGEYKVKWNASKVASGIYFYQLKAAETKITKKALLLK